MTENLSFDQQVFLLNLYSNSAGGKRGTVRELATIAQKAIESQMSEHLDGWKLAWGPSIFMHKKSHIADHLMYAATREATADSPRQIVIAIAGSNGPKTSYNWRVNNLMVCEQDSWDWGDKPQGAKFSKGTSIGLHNLQKIKPLDGFKGSGTIHEFLRSEVGTSPVDVIVTGFSLGGALAPVTALWLLDTQKDSEKGWDPQGNATVSCRPAAGPSIANQQLADYYNQKLGAVTKRLCNDLDVVTLAWNHSDLSKIDRVYEDYVKTPGAIKRLVNLVRYQLRHKGYQHVEKGNHFNNGIIEDGVDLSAITEALTIPPELEGDLDSEAEGNGYSKFIHQVGLQHVIAYIREMKVEHLIPEEAVEAVRAATGTRVEDIPAGVEELLGTLGELEKESLSD